MTPTEAAQRHLAIVLSLNGLSAQTDPAAFGKACAPNGPASAAAFFCQHGVAQGANSPCEVIAVGIVSQLFAELSLPFLQEPLDASGATGQWHRFTALAQSNGALHSPESPGRGIRVGCVVHVEGGAGRHWETVVADLGEGRFRTVDGTLIDGWGCVHSVDRDYRGGVYDLQAGKPVREWVDTAELLDALMPATETDPADSCVDGSAA